MKPSILIPMVILLIVSAPLLGQPSGEVHSLSFEMVDSKKRVHYVDPIIRLYFDNCHVQVFGPEAAYNDIVTFDYDNDGDDDAFMTMQCGSPQLYMNMGMTMDGSMVFALAANAFDEHISTLRYAHSCAACDFDNDGNMDLIVEIDDQFILLRNRGKGRVPRFMNINSEMDIDSPIAMGGLYQARLEEDGLKLTQRMLLVR